MPDQGEGLKKNVAQGQGLAVGYAQHIDIDLLVDDGYDHFISVVSPQDFLLGDVKKTVHRRQDLRVKTNVQIITIVIFQMRGVGKKRITPVMESRGRPAAGQYAFTAERVMRTHGCRMAGETTKHDQAKNRAD
ncbi:hypothetical protein DESC_370050 [Desulfosarcina cetonica]|nr:hypothetical protein DESC_370050 [Desulfosarcina cetonica]